MCWYKIYKNVKIKTLAPVTTKVIIKVSLIRASGEKFPSKLCEFTFEEKNHNTIEKVKDVNKYTNIVLIAEFIKYKQ